MKFNYTIRLLFLAMMLICGFTVGKSMDITVSNLDDTPDRRTFGLVGNVKEVQISITDNSEDIVDDPLIDSQLMTFDEKGRITLDIKDCVYVYDAEGNFIKGEKDYTKMERDEKGRIKRYETRLDDEDPDCYRYTYEYDSKGRPTTIELQLWEGVYTDKFSYSGDNVYPDKLIIEGDEEGDHYSIVVTYEYKSFDKHGNWTERVCNTETRITSLEDTDITQESMSTLEQREITYY